MSSLRWGLIEYYPNPDIFFFFAVNQLVIKLQQINMIGRNLSELVHPDDYAEVVGSLFNRSDHDFSFPECRVTEPIRHRSKTAPVYKMVFLTGYIRECIRTSREKSSQPDKQMVTSPRRNSSWPRLASFIHIYTYYQYMTLHSLDGMIIQSDKR